MKNSIHYTNCPVCNADTFKEVLSAKDYTVSGESFKVVECPQCTLRFTQGVPALDSIAPYYKAESYISHSNSSKGIINRLYQSVRKRTIVQKRKLVQSVTGLQTGTLLDVGSGTGFFAADMKESGWNVKGLEPDPDARKVASDLFNLELQPVENLSALKGNTYDAITLWHVLEHVHDLNEYINRFKSLLTEKGKLIIAVPNYTSFDASVYKEYWAAYDVPRHLYHFSPTAMKVLIEKHGLSVQAYKPMWFDSFYVSMLSSKYKHGKTNLFAAFFNGLRSNYAALKDVKRCSSVIYIIEK